MMRQIVGTCSLCAGAVWLVGSSPLLGLWKDRREPVCSDCGARQIKPYLPPGQYGPIMNMDPYTQDRSKDDGG